MNVRSLVAVAAALSCALVAPSAHAAKPVAMDGVKRTHATIEGNVSTPAYSVETMSFVEPDRADCTTTSCDATVLRVTPPRGSEGGRFKATITMPPELNAAIALYDANGNRVAQAGLLNGGWSCCAQAPYFQASFVVPRLYTGQYSLVVFDRGGAGTFTVDLDYKANPPARKRG